jgi:hypothetical protein
MGNYVFKIVKDRKIKEVKDKQKKKYQDEIYF